LDLKKNLIAVLIVLFVIVNPLVQKILSNKISIFLGKISFPLYVIHMAVICSLTSFLITKEYDPDNTKMIFFYFIITVIVSIISACILYPVEKFAITFSGKIFEYLSTDTRINLKEKFMILKK
jgi:peptidoglycan/LPS O-acetylase OafA/YrhL